MLVGVTHGDDEATARRLAGKVWNLRIFPDEAGAMNRSVADAGGARAGRQPVHALRRHRRGVGGRASSRPPAPSRPSPSSTCVVAELRALGATVETGRFRTHMEVALINDGPVTILLDSAG